MQSLYLNISIDGSGLQNLNNFNRLHSKSSNKLTNITEGGVGFNQQEKTKFVFRVKKSKTASPARHAPASI